MKKLWACLLVSALVVGAVATAVVYAGQDRDKKEEKVTIDQVPAAVKATILKEAGDNKITEIEKETKNGKVVYEAEWKIGSQEVEITVAADGTLISKKTEEDDGDDD